MKLVSIAQAAALLGVAPHTLRRYESPDGKWLLIFGQRIRVHRMSPAPMARRRYDEEEIYRALSRMQRGKVSGDDHS